MGRRALRKIDPALNLSPYLRDAADLPPSCDQAALFEMERPLEVEVGSGKGLFLAAAARGHSGHNFIGIEIARKYARYAAARLARQQSANGRIICGDALVLFRQWIADANLAAVHVYFPDPWWKKRHKKRRVMNEQFLRDVERTLSPEGRLHFWTDVEEYFRTTLELISTATKLAGPLPVAEKPAEHDLDYRTHFERRTRKSELPVYRAEFRKIRTAG
jgi:tRNA (guanine-N7-)-methyltransferase